MAWSYDETALGTSTEAERVNSVRLLIGDTDTNDQQVQNEEIIFALSQNNSNIYYSGSWVAATLASKYARNVDTEFDGQLTEKFSQLHAHYTTLVKQLKDQAKTSGASLGIFAGGIEVSQMETVDALTNRKPPKFTSGQFDND